ncbi:hypothetical protein HDV03_004014 [Kappamyces sp. JEL0829]|nr:hypothetical protein HDV03_004014 [Kappamyces sp. JEL0829]
MNVFAKQSVLTASAAIVLHVFNYNATARLEHATGLLTRVLGGRNVAIYLYALYLVGSALIRDHFIQIALQQDRNSLETLLPPSVTIVGAIAFASGVLLNLWTLHALGIKGMYNGDSFGWLMEAPVTSGPYRWMDEPQYNGTTLALVGSALWYRSLDGLVLAAVLYLVFMVSVHFFERPHMLRLYANKSKKSK